MSLLETQGTWENYLVKEIMYHTADSPCFRKNLYLKCLNGF